MSPDELDDMPVFVVLEYGPLVTSVYGVYLSRDEADAAARYVRCDYDNNHSKAHLFQWEVEASEISA